MGWRFGHALADMKTLILGHTGGIGAALLRHLQDAGDEVTGLSRADGLELGDQNSIADAAEALRGQRFDLIFNATGGLVIDGHPPEKSIARIDARAMAAQFALNAIGVALLLRHFSPLMRPDSRAVFASLSARIGSITDNRLGGWISYRAAKAAQNQIVKTAAIEIARKQKQHIVVALHPGTVQTALTRDYADRYPTITPERAVGALLGVIEGLSPQDSGSFRDWKGKEIPW